MRNGLARHVKTNIKNTKKQNTLPFLLDAECCATCGHAQSGYFTDTMRCPKRDIQVMKTQICDLYIERRE